jgi:four helix bundle protein
LTLVKHFRELHVHKVGFEASMMIFRLSKNWPREEMYSLTDEIRRSSRSACASIAEAWAKRRYPSHFISKVDGR